jgi:MFS family permease
MGALLGGPVADKIGRKWSICSWCGMLHIGLIVQMTAANHKWYQSKINHLYPTSSQQLKSGSCRWKMDCGLGGGSAFIVGTFCSARRSRKCDNTDPVVIRFQCTRARVHLARFEAL